MHNDDITIMEILFVDKPQKTTEDIINKLEHLKTSFHQLSLKRKYCLSADKVEYLLTLIIDWIKQDGE